MPGSTAKDISGQRFGKLTAVHRSGTITRSSGKKRALWMFRCDCGGSVERSIADARRSPRCVQCFRVWQSENGSKTLPRKKPQFDLSGQRFGFLIAISRTPDGRWDCRCDCGAMQQRRACDLRYSLKRGVHKFGVMAGCPNCINRRSVPPPPAEGPRGPREDFLGKQFGRLKVISIKLDGPKGKQWECQCECGGVSFWSTTKLKTVKNPGCSECESYRRAIARITHGETAFGRGRTRLYNIWKGMRKRCADMDDPNYGGKGIRLCDEWENFAVFRDWSYSSGYGEGLTVDRIDPSKGYSPKNCEWVTRDENSRRVYRPRILSLLAEALLSG